MIFLSLATGSWLQQKQHFSQLLPFPIHLRFTMNGKFTRFWMCISISSKDCFNMQDWGVFCLPQNMHYAGNVQALTQNFDKCVISSLQKIIQMIKWVLSFTNIWKLELSLFIKDLNYPRNLIPFFNVRFLCLVEKAPKWESETSSMCCSSLEVQPTVAIL